MSRLFAVLGSAMLIGSVAWGHALYVVPSGSQQVMVVFGHSLQPEPLSAAAKKRMASLKLIARDTMGKTTTVPWKAGENRLEATVPTNTVMVYGTVDNGVFQRGNTPARRTQHLPKAVLSTNDPKSTIIGASCPLEIVPIVEAGKIRFQVLAKNQPVPQAEVEVMVPEQDDHTDATTDEKGFTPAFTAKGNYGVTVRVEKKTPGELNGQKYESEVDTATLVVTVK